MPTNAAAWLKIHAGAVDVSVPYGDQAPEPIHSGLERIAYLSFVSWILLISLSFESSADKVLLTFDIKVGAGQGRA